MTEEKTEATKVEAPKEGKKYDGGPIPKVSKAAASKEESSS